MDWIDIISQKPEEKHIKLRTQFLLFGFYQIENKNSNKVYIVSRLCDYLPDRMAAFELPHNFVLLKWCKIELPN